ncbi:hypothetical protein [Haloferula sargassicola]|uniref:Glycosyl-4,4'-diaponeurosporenoate acyltransferase n=1 Tax=Haloferula sargassicola TaxID=490096 RepID=A0ABP9UWP9_9BACT
MSPDLPLWLLALLNTLGIPATHLAIAWLFTRLPARWFTPGRGIFRTFPWESPAFYDRFFRVRKWKHLLPDAAPWFGGFAKKSLRRRERAFYERFRHETCRGEAAHHAQILAIALIFTPLNPIPWAFLMPLYAILSNLPCILLQRQNRLRLNAVLA